MCWSRKMSEKIQIEIDPNQYYDSVVKKMYTDQYNNIITIFFMDGTTIYHDLMKNKWYKIIEEEAKDEKR